MSKRSWSKAAGVVIIAIGVIGVVLVFVLARVHQAYLWSEEVRQYEERISTAAASEVGSRVEVEAEFVAAYDSLEATIAVADALFLETEGEIDDAVWLELGSAKTRAKLISTDTTTYSGEERVVEGISNGGESKPSRTFFITTGSQPSASDFETEEATLQAAIDAVREAQQDS